MLAAARAGKPRFAGLRLALANLHRPGAPTPIVMLSLGLGLTVLVATALIEGNLRDQLTQRIPSDAPAFFFVDIQSSQMPPSRRRSPPSPAPARSTRCRRCAAASSRSAASR